MITMPAASFCYISKKLVMVSIRKFRIITIPFKISNTRAAPVITCSLKTTISSLPLSCLRYFWFFSSMPDTLSLRLLVSTSFSIFWTNVTMSRAMLGCQHTTSQHHQQIQAKSSFILVTEHSTEHYALIIHLVLLQYWFDLTANGWYRSIMPRISLYLHVHQNLNCELVGELQQESPAEARVTRDSSAYIKIPDKYSSMLQSTSYWWLIASVAVYYWSFATYFCLKRLKIAISENTVMR